MNAADTVAPFTLEPPAALSIPSLAQAASTLVPLSTEAKKASDQNVIDRVNDFVNKIGIADLQSDAFRAMLDKAFSAGRKEIADATGLMNANPVLSKSTLGNFADLKEMKAMTEMSSILAKANPRGQDLLGPIKVLGVTLPFGSKLRSYCDSFKPNAIRLSQLAEVLATDEDAMRREIAEYDVVESQLYDTVTRLDRATEYLTLLDQKIDAEAAALLPVQPEKAKALREEVLFYVRGNLGDVGAVKLLAVVSLGQIRQLRHTGRMTLLATNRIKTLGMAALTISQTIAIAAQKQQQRMETNAKVQAVVNDVIAGVGDTILDHTKSVIEFQSSPIYGLQAMESTIDKTIEAINLYSSFRSAAVDTMKADNLKVAALYQKTLTSMRINQQTSVTAAPLDVLSL